MAEKDYSGTPLPQKLGIGPNARIVLVDAPNGFAERALRPWPPGAELLPGARKPIDVAVLFVTRRAELLRRFPGLSRALGPAGRLWVAWPKKAAEIDTDLTFEAVQRVGLDTGLVDNKSASIDDVFQGLQFVYRLRDRPKR